MLQLDRTPGFVRGTSVERERVLLLIVVLVAAVVRVIWCVYAARPAVGAHDPGFYVIFGQRFADGDGYTLLDGSPTAYFPVGYSLLLGAAFLVTPESWMTGVVAGVNIVAQVVLVVLVYATTRRLLGGSAAAALMAAAVVSLWPNLIFNTAPALTESAFTTLLVAAVLVGVSGRWSEKSLNIHRLVAIGLLLGAATYVRTVTALMLAVFFLAWLVAGSDWKRTATRTAVVGGVMAAILAPWVIRNAVVMDAPVLSTNTGDNVCMSRRPGGSGGFEFPNERCNSGPFDSLSRPAYETERDAQGQRLAWDFVLDHPIEEIRLWPRRLDLALRIDTDGLVAVESFLDDPFMSPAARRTFGRVANGYYYVFGSIGAFGLAMLAWSRRQDALLVALAPVSVLIAIVASFGEPRFKVPILPFLAIGVAVVARRLVLAYESRFRDSGVREASSDASPGDESRVGLDHPDANESATAVTHII